MYVLYCILCYKAYNTLKMPFPIAEIALKTKKTLDKGRGSL